MTRFNKPTTGSRTTNFEGAPAYDESPELKFVSILLTSFVQDQFYQGADSQMEDVKELVKMLDKEFCGKAAIFARHEFGMRSISHVVAGELGLHAKGEDWKRRFFQKVVRRPDDITEILSYYINTYGKPIPNAMKRGLADAFGKFDAYQLGKYRGEGKQISLVDAVNLLHPKPVEKNKEALEKLIKGELKAEGTWEKDLTQAGQDATDEEDKAKRKADAWQGLVKSGKIGYFALLRNLRNIVEDAPDVLDEALSILTDEERIAKSLVLPFRFLTAYRELQRVPRSSDILRGLITASEASLQNIPKFSGRSLIAVDTSASMDWPMSDKSKARRMEVGALLGFAMQKNQGADVCEFADYAEFIDAPLGTPALTQALNLGDGNVGHGTNVPAIFELADRHRMKYDRILIFSDMQSWLGAWNTDDPNKARFEYAKRQGVTPKIYSIDLSGYGTLSFPQKDVYCLAGFSEKIFGIMNMLEQDRNALINKIKEVVL